MIPVPMEVGTPMPCVHPIQAWRNTFSDLKLRKRSAPFFKPPPRAALAAGTVKRSPLPCGRCVECRIDYSRQWAVRGSCELSSVERSSFLTLTYRDADLPDGRTLVKAHYQKFIRALRRRGYKFTYMICGEYGDRLGRPHYHAIIFGEDFMSDAVVAPVAQSAEMPLYSSAKLNEIWGRGYVVFGQVSFASIQYVASYITKKINGEMAREHYKGRVPEFMKMSLKTPIGSRWFDRFWSDIYPRDEFVFVDDSGSTVMRPPKYFQKRYSKMFPDSALDLSVKRESVAESMAHLWTPERLAARKAITLAKFREHVRRFDKEIAA